MTGMSFLIRHRITSPGGLILTETPTAVAERRARESGLLYFRGLMVRVLAGILGVVVSFTALAHGGGIDRCGGHNDRKRGGYHVHNMAKYCACNPSAAECKKAPADQKRKGR